MRRPALGWLLAVVLLARPAAAEDGLRCRTLRGPCTFLDTINVLLGPAGAPPVLVANFGLVASDGSGRLQFSCEAGLGGLAVRTRMSPAGAIFVAGDQGLMRYQRACAGRAVAGEAKNQPMLDIAFDPADPARMWALGMAPRAIFLSLDGGASFARGWQFPAGEDVLTLLAAPSRPDVVYAAGDRASDGRLLLSRSDDGGRTFAAVAGQVPEGIPLALLGIDPASPDTLLVAVRASDGSGDGIWRSIDGGRSWTRTLMLPSSEVLGGFTFAGATVYAAGRAWLFTDDIAPGHLYVSGDGGASFGPGIPSPRPGPRYRCLAFRDGRLYACGAGALGGDAFLLGVSPDGGKSWTAIMDTDALAGPEPCLRATCADTSAWLCETYGLCGADGGVDASAVASAPSGCHCHLGRSPQRPSLWLLALLACWRFILRPLLDCRRRREHCP